jgi:hypothetical protein
MFEGPFGEGPILGMSNSGLSAGYPPAGEDPAPNTVRRGAVAYLRKPVDVDAVMRLTEAHCLRQYESAPGNRPPHSP